MKNQGKLLGTREIAERLNYSQREMQEWCRQGKFQTAIMVGKQWRISENEVLAILEKKDELSKQPKTPVITEKLILDITKLAKTLEWLIYTPEPKTILLDFGRKSKETQELVNQLSKGNGLLAASFLATSMRTPWWCTDSKTSVHLSLTRQHEALFNRFLALTTTHNFTEAFNDWKLKTDVYLELVRSGSEVNTIKTVYREVKQTETIAHIELWKAVEGLRWTDR